MLLSPTATDAANVVSVTLHSSWRGVLSGLVGSGAVLLAGAASTAASGGAWGSLALLALGTALLMIVLFDYPVATEFDPDGVVRRPVLRRHRIAWTDIDQLTRARPSFRGPRVSGSKAVHRTGGDPAVVDRRAPLKPGGLAAKMGRRRYLLVDQCESLDEHTRLLTLLDDRSAPLSLDELVVPPDGVDPTWTYRRKRWQPTEQA